MRVRDCSKGGEKEALRLRDDDSHARSLFSGSRQKEPAWEISETLILLAKEITELYPPFRRQCLPLFVFAFAIVAGGSASVDRILVFLLCHLTLPRVDLENVVVKMPAVAWTMSVLARPPWLPPQGSFKQ